jgi:metal-responsive CopG/Arc/MetJ family transcriptional regulator
MQINVPQTWLDGVDAWRRTQPEIPNRSEAIRQLVDRALAPKRARRPSR